MRITILNQFYKPDIPPTATLAADLAEHFAQEGHDVTVVASRGGYVDGSQEAGSGMHAGVRVCRVWTPQLGKSSILNRCIDYAVFYVLCLFRLLTLRRQDVVIALTTPPFIAWAGALHKMLHRRCRLVLWNMDCYPEVAERVGTLKADGKAARLMKWANGCLFNRLDHLVCLDRAMADLLSPYHAKRDAGGRALPVSVIPNWEKAAAYPRDADPGAWQEINAMGLTGRFIVLYMGNMGVGHDFETILGAAEQLKDKPVTFLFIGGGKRFIQIEQAVRERALDNVLTRPYLPWEEVPRAMRSGHCALITLRDDMLGVMSPSKVHANLASGLPVLYIGPPRSNVDEAVTRLDCGLSVRHGQAEQVASFIRRLMNDPAYHAGLRRRARDAFDKAYSDTATLPMFDPVIAPHEPE